MVSVNLTKVAIWVDMEETLVEDGVVMEEDLAVVTVVDGVDTDNKLNIQGGD